MNNSSPYPDDLELLWDHLLSRQPELVRQAFQSLQPGEQAAVLQHLQRMASEDGWHPEQRRSAQAALTALQGQKSA
jgi:hypothetical protein